MPGNQEIRPDLDDGIDRKALTQLRKRFLRVNQGRLLRANQALSTRQQFVLKLLPLLLHVNHPMLPGYVSGSTPSGLCGYEPDDEVLAQAQRLTRAFTYKAPRGKQQSPLLGLFLMGSLGTLAQADQSDMDLWLCHAPGLNEQALEELRKKCSLLEVWAATQGSEVHFFLIDPERFRLGERGSQLTSDDCGTTQHYLLLDEFYRTAIWLGGRTPMWWLVPAFEESRYQSYAQTLLEKRFVRHDETLDLGSLAHIPPGEFIGAGLWQLYKGIRSPYKSVLKLLLTEIYASEHPRVECLSLRFKHAVFANKLELDELDPYIVVYRRIEEYLLERNEHQRLELIRRCLYLKANKKLSRPPRNGVKSWQRVLLERLSSEWQWDRRKLALLDSRSQWKVRQVKTERHMLVNELTYSYRFLVQLSRNLRGSSTVSHQDLAILGRRLYAAFERKAAKVELINPGIAPDLGEDTITLVNSPSPEAPSEQQWALFSGSLGAQDWPNFAPIKRTRDLIELLAWSHFNGIIDSGTRISLHPGSSDLTEFELSNLLLSLRQSLTLPLPPVGEAALRIKSQPSMVLLLINVGLDPLKQHSQMNVHMTTERIDALGYSGVRENLVQSIDQVSLNSWNELSVHRYSGQSALIDCLQAYLNRLPKDAPPPKLQIRCYCRNRAMTIAERVEELFNQVQSIHRTALRQRYIIQTRQRFHVLELGATPVSYSSLDDINQLIEHLGSPHNQAGALHVDRSALQDDDLGLILPTAKPDCIQVFYRIVGNGGEAELSVLDERNALWRQRLPFTDEHCLLTPIQRFLQSLLYRRNALQSMAEQLQTPPEVLYYQVLPDAPGNAKSLIPCEAPQSPINHPFYDVQAIINPAGAKGVRVTLYCNHQEFSQLQYAGDLYAAVAQHILAHRRGGERYPCYITDVDLSAIVTEEKIQTLHYLRYKTTLEAALNMALHNA
ncbi:class I adenylate cyclase [Pseudomonas segetis]|uniref:Adenylate cyclase n=1 Tax=Pseudomonas segetis TaxID=298908 RepID=A0A239FYD8_9PSED|nr:class I adenylate cyclase [Pseudomonas segetis]SNS62057.1 adenylate cyclase [Pseudomonas segetis]